MLGLPTKRFKYSFIVSLTNMEEELKNQIRIILRSATMVYESKDYTSAAILYFKVIFITLDLLLYRKRKITPKDHTERFRMLEREFPEEYELLDKYFQIYRDTYSLTIDAKTCEEVKNYATKTITRVGI